MRLHELRTSVNAYIGLVATLGTSLLVLWVVIVPSEPLDLPNGLTVVVLGSLSVWLPLRFYRGGGVVGFNLLGAVFIAAVLTVPLFWAPVLVGIASFIGYATKVREPRKVLFNSAQETAWAIVSAAAVGVLGIGTTATSPRSVVAALVGATTMVVLNFLFLQELFRRLEDRTFREHLQRTATLFAMTVVGNLIYGLVLAVTLRESPLAAMLTGILLAAVSIGYRGFAAVEIERVRIGRLHAMSQELVEASYARSSLHPVMARVAELFQATSVQLDVRHGEMITHVDGELDPSDTTLLSVPIEQRGRKLGALTVRGRQGLEPWGEADTNLLQSVANDLAVVIQNHRLFDEVDRERSSLATETAKLSDILTATSDGITLIGTDDRVASWNPAMERLTGMSEQAATGRPWYGVLRLRDEAGREIAPADAHVLSMALKGIRTEVSVLWQAMRDDGEWRWVQCTASPVERATDGGAVLVMRDVTASTEVEQLKNDFIATVSHELRTPMTPLKGFLSTLTKHGDDLDERQRHIVLSSMHGQISRLDTLVGDLLAVAELAGGQFDLESVRVPLRRLVTEIVAERSSEDSARVEVEGDEVGATSDREGVRRIVLSLVDNALKHTTGPVRVHVTQDESSALVTVSDDGPGIHPRDHDRIFERFVRLGNHLHRTQGPGLGLTIARALTQQMGGEITLRSSSGAGSEFALRLPLAASGAGTPSDSLADPRSQTIEDARGPSPTTGPPRSLS